MEPTLASLYPIHQIGSDGFNWWVGQIESGKDDDPKKSGRYRVRIVGQHLKDCNSTKTEDLPWANVMMPVTSPFTDGLTTGASVGLEPGNWVIGFYLDNDKQKPIIIGSIGHTKGSTIIKNDDPAPGSSCKSFTTFISNDVVPQQDYPINAQKGKNDNDANVALAGPPAADNGNKPGELPPAVAAVLGKRSETNPTGSKHCYIIANPKCGGDSNLKNSITSVVGDLLRANQESGGQLGNYLVSKANGFLYDKVSIARYHIGRIVQLVKSFVARVKGEIVKLIKDGINKLIDTLLKVEDAEGAIIGNTGPLADPDKAFKPIREKGNRLKAVKKIFDEIFEELGCSIEDITDKLAQWIFDTIFGYLTDLFYEAACFVDTLIDGILNQILSLLDTVINTVLGPLQQLLDTLANPINLISSAINSIMSLLGISCSGPSQKCDAIQKVCTDCTQNDNEDDKDFLDKLIAQIEDGPLDSGGICDEARNVPPTEPTQVVFLGGVLLNPPTTTVTTPPLNPSTPNEFLSTASDPDNESNAPINSDDTDSPEIPDAIPQTTINDAPDEDPNEPQEGQEYTVTSDRTVYNEGDTIVYTIRTLNVPDNTTSTYTMSGSEVQPTDIVEGLTGSFVIISNTAEVSVTIASDGVVETTPKQIRFEIDDQNAFTDIIVDPNIELVPGIDDNIVLLPTYSLVSDATTYDEGEDIICTVTTTNVPDNTILNYTLFGTNITTGDFINDSLSGQVTINNNTGRFILGIREDTQIEDAERLNIVLNGTGESIVVTINGQQEENPAPQAPDQPLIITKPTAGTPITDENGSIISIPIENSGNQYQTAPNVIIGGQGYGATAIALLDEDGFVTEVRVTRTGVNYQRNVPNINTSCVIDSFTLLSPGVGYETAPTVYIDGEEGLAEALIDVNGYVIGVRSLDRTRTYDRMPQVLIVGGDGAGARVLPNITCLDTIELERRGYAKIGTGRYIDCP